MSKKNGSQSSQPASQPAARVIERVGVADAAKMTKAEYDALRAKADARQIHLQGSDDLSALNRILYLGGVHVHPLAGPFRKSFRFPCVHFEGSTDKATVTVWSQSPDYTVACRATEAALKRGGLAVTQKRVGVYEVTSKPKPARASKPASQPEADTASQPASEPATDTASQPEASQPEVIPA